jgi:hypothetical protein
MRIHPLAVTAVVALVVVIGYDKLKGGAGSKMRIGS